MAGDQNEPEMQLVAAEPAPPLRGIVIEYRGFAAGWPSGPAWRAYPSLRIPLVVELGAGWRIATPATGDVAIPVRGFVAGMHDGVALVSAAGPTRGVQIDLTPLGARQLLGLPMQSLTNRVVALDDLLGREAHRLAERLTGVQCWPERFAAIDAILTSRLATAAPVSPGVAWAWSQLVATAGAMPIGRLTEELGWSRGRLGGGFHDAVGLSPKEAARVVRFAALTTRLRAGPLASWADLAADLGYCDQAHLAREVRRLAGLTPTQLGGELAVHPRADAA